MKNWWKIFSYLRFEAIDKPGILSNITKIFSKNKVQLKGYANPDKNRKSLNHYNQYKSKDRFLKTLNEVAEKYIKHKPKLIRIDEN